jgi:hypothetical protein
VRGGAVQVSNSGMEQRHAVVKRSVVRVTTWNQSSAISSVVR